MQPMSLLRADTLTHFPQNTKNFEAMSPFLTDTLTYTIVLKFLKVRVENQMSILSILFTPERPGPASSDTSQG